MSRDLSYRLDFEKVVEKIDDLLGPTLSFPESRSTYCKQKADISILLITFSFWTKYCSTWWDLVQE